MNRKQAGIILTLLALIICTGILATKVNSEMKNGNGLGDLTASSSKKDESTSTSTDYFYEARNLREQEDSKTVETLKAIISDPNTSAEEKKKTTTSLTQKTTARDYETRIELSVKSKGFEDAICFIEGNKAKVVVKNDKELTDVQTNEIQDIVINVANIFEVTIQSK